MLWKLILVNGLVIGIAIWLAGVSVVDFACLLVKQYPFVGSDESRLFNEAMEIYFLKASLLAMLVAGIVHYFFVQKLLQPLKLLSKATQEMAKGKYPAPLHIFAQDEMGQLAADFNYLTQKLKQTEDLRKKMVSDIAHELRTPLTNINGYLEALSIGMVEGNRELYQSLHEESLRITRLVEQLHELNVWESRKLTGKITEGISIGQLIQASLDSFSLEFRHRGMNVKTCVEDYELYGDRDGLMQVMVNLLKNVLQYDQGGWVNIEGKVDKQDYLVTMTNLGKPIPIDQAEHIFDRFYRLDPSRSRQSGGSGLGLSLVKEIVEQHQGQVGLLTDGEIHSFWFTLPISFDVREDGESGDS